MRIAAAALRTSLWLAWLSLLAAVLAAEVTAGARAHQDAGVTLAQARVATPGDVVPSRRLASDDDTGNQDELSANAALPSQTAWTPRPDGTHLTGRQSDPGKCGSPTTLLSPRAPPVVVSL